MDSIMTRKHWIIFTIVLALISISYAGRSRNKVLSTVISNTRDKVVEITNMAVNMVSYPETKALVTAGLDTISTKIDKINVKLNSTYGIDDNKAGKVAGVINGIASGIGPFVNGIKNKDWKSGLKGALTIISSVVALAGPVGIIASSVLALVSSILDLFGGSEKSESMDDKIERIVKEQINIAREKDLKEDVEGFKVAYSSLKGSVQHFRESKNMTEEQANELYNHAFTDLTILGKLVARINEICDDLQSKDKSYEEAKKCLGFIQMYSELSILRQILLMEMATLLSDIYNINGSSSKRGKTRSVKRGGSKTENGLLVVSNNLLHLIQDERETDATILGFLVDPFDNPSRRYVTAVFFAFPDNFPSLKTYLMELHNCTNCTTKGMLFKNYIMACDSTNLGGSCRTFENPEYPDLKEDPGNWQNEIVSFYIPIGLQMEAYQYPKYEGLKWGPFTGPLVHGIAAEKHSYDSLIIMNTTRVADNEVRFCETKKMGIGRCDTVGVGKYDLGNFHGSNWNDTIKSIYIPEGLHVKGCTQPNMQGACTSMYTGPYKVNDVQGDWQSILVSKTKDDARNFAEVCEETNLAGKCFVTGSNATNLEKFGGVNVSGRIYSLKIPGGMHVTGYTKKDFEGNKIGPYSGPALISRVDDGNLWMSMKLEYFI